MLIELYCRENIRKEAWAPRPEPGTSYHNLQVRKAEEQMTSIRADLDSETMKTLSSFLKENVNIFAWKPRDMLVIDPNLFCHKLE